MFYFINTNIYIKIYLSNSSCNKLINLLNNENIYSICSKDNKDKSLKKEIEGQKIELCRTK